MDASPSHPRLLQVPDLKEAANWTDLCEEAQASLKHVEDFLFGDDGRGGGGEGSAATIISRESAIQLFSLTEKVFASKATNGGCPWPQCPQVFEALHQGIIRLLTLIVDHLSVPLTQPSQGRGGNGSGDDDSSNPATTREVELVSLVCEKLLELDRFVGGNFLLLSTVWKSVVQLARSHYRSLATQGHFRSQEALVLLTRYAEEGGAQVETLLKHLMEGVNAAKASSSAAVATAIAPPPPGGPASASSSIPTINPIDATIGPFAQVGKLMSFFLLRMTILASLFGPSIDNKTLRRAAFLYARYTGWLDARHSVWRELRGLLRGEKDVSSNQHQQQEQQGVWASFTKIRTHADQHMLPKVESAFIKILAGPAPPTPPPPPPSAAGSNGASSSGSIPPPPLSSSSSAVAAAAPSVDKDNSDNEVYINASIRFLTVTANLAENQQAQGNEAISLGLVRLLKRLLVEDGPVVQRALPIAIQGLVRALVSLHALMDADLQGLLALRQGAIQAIAHALARHYFIDVSTTQSLLMSRLFDPHPIIRDLWISVWQVFLRLHCTPAVQDHLLCLLIGMITLPSLGILRRTHLCLLIPRLLGSLPFDIKIPLLSLLVSQTLEALRRAFSSINDNKDMQHTDKDSKTALARDLTTAVKLCAKAFRQEVDSEAKVKSHKKPLQRALSPLLDTFHELEVLHPRSGNNQDSRGLGALGLAWTLAYWDEMVPGLNLPREPRKALCDICINLIKAGRSSSSNSSKDSLEIAITTLATVASRPNGGQGLMLMDQSTAVGVLQQVQGLLERPPAGFEAADFAIMAMTHLRKITEAIVRGKNVTASSSSSSTPAPPSSLVNKAAEAAAIEDIDVSIGNLWQSLLSPQAPWAVQACAQSEVDRLKNLPEMSSRPFLSQALTDPPLPLLLAEGGEEGLRNMQIEEGKILHRLGWDVLATLAGRGGGRGGGAVNTPSSSALSRPSTPQPLSITVGNRAIVLPLEGDQHALLLVPETAWSTTIAAAAAASSVVVGGGEDQNNVATAYQVMQAVMAEGQGKGLGSGLVTNVVQQQQQQEQEGGRTSMMMQMDIIPQ